MTVSAIKSGIKGVLKACLNVSAPLYSRVSSIDASSARETLNRFSPKPAGTPDATNLLPDPRCDLQIVIPAYNVESYLAKCMDSVLSQKTKYTYHVVLVDDGSTDATPAIADRYAADSRVTVIHQENRGFSGARNVGLSTLFGRYIMFVDSDDYLPQGAMRVTLWKAELTISLTKTCPSCTGTAMPGPSPTPAMFFTGSPGPRYTSGICLRRSVFRRATGTRIPYCRS